VLGNARGSCRPRRYFWLRQSDDQSVHCGRRSSRKAYLVVLIVHGRAREHADPPHPFGLLRPHSDDNSTALQKLKSGELAALVRVIGKPVGFFAQVPANSGLHLVPIRFSKTFTDHYALGEFTSEEYPTLVPHGQKIDTIAVPAALAVHNCPKNTDRYRRVQRFTEALFAKWDKFMETTVPGWTRWSVAEEMLNRMQKDPRVAEFWSFLRQQNPAVAHLTLEQREALFQAFLKWQNERVRR